MLLGTYPVKFVTGHRLAVPSIFRKQLGEIYILARWYEGCLVLIGKDNWDALYKRLTGDTKVLVSPLRSTERFILGSAYEVLPDEQGRIVIPEALMGYSNLGEDVCFVGLGEKIEIWDKNIWSEKEKEIVKEAAVFIEELSKQK